MKCIDESHCNRFHL